MDTPIIDALMELRLKVLAHTPGPTGVTEVALSRDAGRALERELVGFGHRLPRLPPSEKMFSANFAGVSLRWPA